MTIFAFERTLRRYVALGSGLAPSNVLPGNDRSPRPVDPYASLLFIGPIRRLGYPVRRQQTNETTSSISYRRAPYSLQFYRKGAMQLAQDFCIYAESEDGLTIAEDGGFRVVQHPTLTWDRVDDIIGDGYEERALVNLMVDYAVTSTQDTGYIDAFTGEICYGPASITVTHP